MTRERYLAAATAWDAAGRPDTLLYTNEYQLLALRCWFQSDGAAREGRDQVVADFGDACEKTSEVDSPHWWGRLLAFRLNCDRCGERYMIENLSICTKCLGTYCFNCIDTASAPNGNRIHHCGGEIVG